MNHLLVDYLTISFKFSTEFKSFMLKGLEEKEQIEKSSVFPEYFKQWIFEKLHLPEDKMESRNSRYSGFGYDACFYYDGIWVYTGVNSLMLDMTGKGCRTCEDLNKGFDWYIFIHQFDEMIRFRNSAGDPSPVHISRLDIAYDDINNKTVTIPLLQRYIRNKHFVSRANYVSCIDGNYEQAIYFGSPKSDRRLRIYDKRMQQLGKEDDIPWVRWEFQLRNENALSFYFNLCDLKGDFAKCYFGVLSNFVTFTSKSRLDVGAHTERLQPVKWWSALVGNVLKLGQLYLPGREYTLKSIQDYFNKQCLSAAKSVLLLELAKNDNDCSSFINAILDAELNDKQLSAVEKALRDYRELKEREEQENADNGINL